MDSKDWINNYRVVISGLNELKESYELKIYEIVEEKNFWNKNEL